MRFSRIAIAYLLAAPIVIQPAWADSASHVQISVEDAAPGRIAPLRDFHGLLKPKAEDVLRLSNARVVMADYDLIKHDFKHALEVRYSKPVDQVSHEEMDAFLLDHAAYISRAQAEQTAVNTLIPVSQDVKPGLVAYRPKEYGRAMVFAHDGVLIDVKGTGAVEPKQEDHENGLATLGEAIREYAYEKLVHRILEHAGMPVKTVGHYAVIDGGFDVRWKAGNTDRAGLVLRQAHSRFPGVQGIFTSKDMLPVEMVLRQYGVTSAGAYQDQPFDKINVQGTREKALLDFGGFLTMDHFEKPAYHFDHAPDEETPHRPLLVPGKKFVQPDPAVRVPFNLWGYTATGKADPKADNPWQWSHELANALASGRATKADAEQHMRNLMGPVEERFRANPPPARMKN